MTRPGIVVQPCTTEDLAALEVRELAGNTAAMISGSNDVMDGGFTTV